MNSLLRLLADCSRPGTSEAGALRFFDCARPCGRFVPVIRASGSGRVAISCFPIDLWPIRCRPCLAGPCGAAAACIMLHMRLSARADYALRAAIELATAGGSHVTAEQLARAQKIPGKFLEAILTQLRRAGLVRSQRGPEGGFWLARPAEDISLADIIRAIDGQLVGVRGERPENIGYIGAAEPLQSVWIALRANERAILEEVTLAHIVTGQLPARVVELTDDPRAWA